MGEEYSKEFEKRTHEYCDNYVGEKVLSTAFSNLWIQSISPITPKDLVTETSKITSDLVKRSILIEVKKKSNPDNPVYNFYPMFEILPHKRLIKE